MTILSRVIRPAAKKEETVYPIIKEHNDPIIGPIVMFMSPNTGIVIGNRALQSDNVRLIGEYSKNFTEANYHLFEGEVTLKNP